MTGIKASYAEAIDCFWKRLVSKERVTGMPIARLRENVVMLTPPLRDRGPLPALEGDRVGAAIRAHMSVGAAIWK